MRSYIENSEYTPVEIDDDLMLVMPGPLQLAILNVLWRDEDGMSLMRLYRTLQTEYKSVALSGVSTTATRLLRRGWVVRPRRGYYRAGISRDDLIALISAHIEQA